MKTNWSFLIVIAFVITAFVGEVKCIIKAFNCNWEPVGKAELVYTIASVTGLGCVVGYIDIKDK